MGDIQIGNLGSVSQIYAGSTEIAQVYVGSTLIWEGGAPPVPIPTSGLTAWYGDTVNNGVDRTTLANGAAITQWDDLSGNGWHLTGTSAYSASTNSIEFSTSDTMKNEDFAAIAGVSQNWTIIFLSRYKSDNTSTRIPFYLGQPQDIAGFGERLQFQYISNNNQFQLNVKGSNSSSNWNNVYVGDTEYLQVWKLDGTTNRDIDLRNNGVDETRDNIPNQYTTNIDNGLVINGRYLTDWNDWSNGTEAINQDSYELIVYDRALSTVEIQQVELYLNNKYSIY